MTDRRSHAIQVFGDQDGDIRIQWMGGMSDDAFVCITVAQAEQVCKWIMDVAKEIESEANPDFQVNAEGEDNVRAR